MTNLGTWIKHKPRPAVGMVVLALVLYLVGVKFFFVPSVIYYLVVTLAFPKVFESIFSKVIVSLIVLYGLYQIVVTLQFIFLPNTQFKISAAATALLVLSTGFLTFKAKHNPETLKWFNARDLGVVVACFFFVVPLMVFCFGRHGVAHIAGIGSIQGVDGTNHFAQISDRQEHQRITYKVGNYYPTGFHMATAFAQDSFSVNQATFDWDSNANLYISQYIFVGFLMTFSLYYLAIQIGGRYRSRPYYVFVALGLAPALSIFYLVPFLYNGFLSYFYIVATIACALSFLYEHMRIEQNSDADYQKQGLNGKYVYLIGFLLLIYGASMSWPLLIPALVLTGMLGSGVALRNLNFNLIKNINPSFALVLIGFAIQAIPIYFQLRYFGSSDTQGLNNPGGLKILHTMVITAAFIMLIFAIVSKNLNPRLKQYLVCCLAPLYLLVGTLAAYQYFSLGEVTYYVIKTAYLIEIFTLVYSVGFLALVAVKSDWSRVAKLFVVIVVPPLLLMTFIGMNDNPLKDLRSLLRSYSSEPKPQYFDDDVVAYKKLGEAGKITEFNSTLLHYDSVSGKFYAHMQIPFWANMMQYGADTEEFKGEVCSGGLYANLLFSTFTQQEQAELTRLIKRCAEIAQETNKKYYIVTDNNSLKMVKAQFGGKVTTVTD